MMGRNLTLRAKFRFVDPARCADAYIKLHYDAVVEYLFEVFKATESKGFILYPYNQRFDSYTSFLNFNT